MAVKTSIPGNPYGTCMVCGLMAVHREHHQCPPVWRVRVKGDGPDESREVRARDAGDAAVEFCERYDSDLDYTIIRNEGATLIVGWGDDEVEVSIEAESRPNYTAHIET